MTEASDRHALARRRLQRAGGDLRAARLLLATGEDDLLDIICFHAQQCAEKAVKALLTYHGVDPPHTHDLDTLLRAAPEATGVGVGVADLVDLDPYAVELRYADDVSHVERSDAERAIEIAELVWADVRRQLAGGP